ncbi:MAG: aminopeptidase P N-terminal domain-containing protein [Fimbriimonadaceae bacterium]
MHALIAALVLAPFSQQSAYPVYETDKISPAEHRQRREKLMRQMAPGTLAVFFTNPERNRNNDVDFQFRADSDFLYLTGFEEPNAALVLIPDGVNLDGQTVREVLFVNEGSEMSITWLGYRMGPANVVKLLGIQAGRSNAEFAAVLALLGQSAPKKAVSMQMPPDPSGGIARMIKETETWREAAGFASGGSLRGALSTMRGVKSPAEIAMLKKVSEITARAHSEAMRSAEPNMREWEIGALVKYIFAKEGCEYEGYPPICGSGPNSTILHYNTNRRVMKAGDVMCMDTAGEYHGYSADVTRSYPISGKWSKEQRAIYNVVLAAQNAGIAACRPGVTTGAVGQAVSDSLAKGMIALGIIKEPSELRRYYMHGFGHGIGLDVHDPMPRTLEAGVTLSVEPGIYIKEGSPTDKKWWNIGIRIEDSILVTTGSPINLSAGAPRDPDAIERLMAEKGLGNIK